MSACSTSVLGPARWVRGPSVSHILIPHQNRTAEPKTSDRARKLANALAERDRSRLSDSLPGTPCRVCEEPSWYWSSALSGRSNRTIRRCFGIARLPRSAATTRATCKPWCPDVTRRCHRAVTSRHAPSSLPLNFGFYVNVVCFTEWITENSLSCFSFNVLPIKRVLYNETWTSLVIFIVIYCIFIHTTCGEKNCNIAILFKMGLTKHFINFMCSNWK